MEHVIVLKNVHLEEVSNQELVPEDTECVARVGLSKIFQSPIGQNLSQFSVQKTCGGSSSENCTYFQSSGTEVGQCRLRICPCNENICQLRLDFQTFVINQPKLSEHPF